jgi:hypothetical protein
MHTDQPILPSSRKIKIIAASVPCLLVLYILSFGAVVKLDDRDLIGEHEDKILRVVYAPICLLGIIPGADRIFDWYIFDVWKCDPMTTR